MIVNDDKLKKLINHVTQECYYCPLSYGGGLNSCGKLDSASCEEMMFEWLQEFDIAEALEEVDLYKSKEKEIPVKLCWGVPCEEDNVICDSDCVYWNDPSCPYD